MIRILLLSALLVAAGSLQAQDLGLFQKKMFIQGKDTLLYRILYPESYKANKKYPVITFLHGSGERGNDNEAQLTHGGKLFVNDSVRKDLKAIVIFPQCPKDSSWRSIQVRRDTMSVTGRAFDFTAHAVPTTPARLVKALLDSLQTTKKADSRRMYIGGLSMGGFGTFDMLERYPYYFAAALPICGGGDTTKAALFAQSTPAWIFHGDQDKAVDVKYSRDYYAALKNAGSDVKYTEYPGVEHNSWDNAFAEKELLPWLLSHKRKRK
jgi:predicted peptidase